MSEQQPEQPNENGRLIRGSFLKLLGIFSLKAQDAVAVAMKEIQDLIPDMREGERAIVKGICNTAIKVDERVVSALVTHIFGILEHRDGK